MVRLQKSVDPKQATFALPRINFTINDTGLPVKILRRQIPVQLAWASSVHRVQGNDLMRVMVDLQDVFFSHGQLHVAMSRRNEPGETQFIVTEKDLFDIESTNVVVPQMLFAGPYEN